MKVMLKPGTPKSGRKEVIKSVELKERWGEGGAGGTCYYAIVFFIATP